MTDLTILQSEIQDRCDALTGISSATTVLEVAMEAYACEAAGGTIDRTILSVQLQRIADESDGTTPSSQLVLAAAASKDPNPNAGTSKRIIKNYTAFTTNGSFSWVVPTNLNGSVVYVTMIGGGSSGSHGNGTNQGSGGYAGQFYFKVPYDIGVSTTVSVVVGTGGASKTTIGNGNVGAPSSFGLLVAVGGVASLASGWDLGSTNFTSVSWPGGRPRTSTSVTDVDGMYIPSPLPCPWAAPVHQAFAGTNGFRTGASGLIVPGVATPVAGNWTTAEFGGIGFGAGGAGTNSSNTGAGARGFVFVEWEEYVDA